MITTTINADTSTNSFFPPVGKLNSPNSRIESIDLLRGLVIIIMTLDHVRDYFHADAFLFNPLDLTQTTPAIFLTRWVTHFCAPVFVFLAGTSAFLVGERKGKVELTSFLLKRGLWLILVEFTIMNVAWFFNFRFSLMVFQVIGALGFGMLVLAFMSRLPFRAVLISAIVILVGHNLLDGFTWTEKTDMLWVGHCFMSSKAFGMVTLHSFSDILFYPGAR
jgi:uncharacterized membrane protein